MNFCATASLDFPDADNTAGTTLITISRRIGPRHLSIAWNGALPTGGSVQVLVLKDGGTEGTIADYDVLTSLTAPGTIRVAQPRGAIVRGMSGTGTGNVRVTVIAE